MKQVKLVILLGMGFLWMFCSTDQIMAQVGVYYTNEETGDYISSMQDNNFTYLVWDRNDDGDGHFSNGGSPKFFYWDNDISQLHYLIDTENMKALRGDFYSITSADTVRIGTTIADAMLTVKGNIHAEEVTVDLSVPGPDYVFEEGYELTTLEETENYIKANKHLPEIPSAKEMEAEGIDLGVMDMLLLKKIEELTLHVIELQKVSRQQQKELNEIKSTH